MACVEKTTEVATIKLKPRCRAAWETAAAAEARSLANMFEVAVLDYCTRREIARSTVALIVALSKPTPRRRQLRNQKEG